MLGWGLPGGLGAVKIWEAICGGGREARGHDPVTKTGAQQAFKQGGSGYPHGSSPESPRMNGRVSGGAEKALRDRGKGF